MTTERDQGGIDALRAAALAITKFADHADAKTPIRSPTSHNEGVIVAMRRNAAFLNNLADVITTGKRDVDSLAITALEFETV